MFTDLLVWAMIAASAFIVTLIVLTTGRLVMKARRHHTMKQAAARLGLTYEAHNPNLGREQFAVLSRGDGNGTENFLTGVWRGNPVTVFDAWYFLDVSPSEYPMGLRWYRRYTMAVARIDHVAPHVVIAHDGWLKSRLFDRKRMRRRTFESDAFNKRFTVRCDDQRFASAAVDARMMRWLMSTKGHRYEIFGNYVVCWTTRTNKLELLMLNLFAFRDHIPPVTWEVPVLPAVEPSRFRRLTLFR